MKIIVRHKPTDLLRVGLYATLHSASLWWTLLLLAVVIFGINLKQQGLDLKPITVFAIVLTTAVFTAVAFAIITALSVLSTLIRNGRSSPAAELHTYSLADAGLSRQSTSSETLIKWGGARSLHKGASAIYVGVTNSSFLILPRHAFDDDEAYLLFWEGIQKLLPSISATV